MTHKRSWLALAALLAAIIGGTVWAAEQEKAAPPASVQGEIRFDTECRSTTDKKCCDEKCCTKEEAKTCCEGKCCATEKGKGCCADGKCCGCCDKAKQAVTLPAPPGSSIQVLVAPPTAGLAYDMPFAPPPPPCVVMPPLSVQGCGSSWASTTVPQAAQPMQYTPQSPRDPGAFGNPVPQAAQPMQYTPVTQYVANPPVVPPPRPFRAPSLRAPRRASFRRGGFGSWRTRTGMLSAGLAG